MTTTMTGTTTSTLVARPLSDGWRVRAISGPVPDVLADRTVAATVPGNVHLDLLAAGLIPDPYLDNNEALLAWIGLTDWTYTTTLTATAEELAAHEHHELVFDGIDTVATVSLNGVTLADVANQHRSYRLDVTHLLRAGGNTLTVAFRSPMRAANQASLELGARPRPYPFPYEAIRKSACSFGWDWGIATCTSGLWRAVRWESWSSARLDEVRVVATPEGTGGQVTATVRVTGTADEVTLEVAGRTVSAPVSADGETVVRLDLDDVRLWWPIGYGDQPLYDVRLSLLSGGAVLDSATRRVGFRTVAWNTAPDDDGTPFQLVVNDQPIFVKGVNWIPDDAFPTRIGRDRYERRLRQAARANLNLIRVWGGGIFESDDFFDLCDELGLLSWQDFLFACAAYPEEEPLRSEVEAEARENVARLGHHASLVLLTGNNENLWGYEDWGWKERLDGRTWGGYYYHDLLPAVVAELAPHVPYSPGSPFSPGGEHPNAEQHGTMHIWDLWNQRDWPHYRDYVPRFVAEFGWQGPPAWTTLRRSISDEPLTPESPGMVVHQKAMEGNVKLTTGLIAHYRVPDDMETWHWAMQLNQANAITCALDHFRSYAPRTSGAVVWQLNDCWPVTSWAAIDGDGREKPLFHALRNAFAARVVTLQPRGEDLVAVLGNDTDEAWAGELLIRRRTFAGDVEGEQRTSVVVPARSSATVPVSVGSPTAPGAEVLVAEVDGIRGWWWYAEGRDSELADPRLDVAVSATEDGCAVTVTAGALVRDLMLLVDKVAPDASVDEGLVTLLPGEQTTFLVSGTDVVDPQVWSDPRILRSANQLVTR